MHDLNDLSLHPPSTHRFRAAQYLRMSTEHQQYSIANQSAAIAIYAAAHNIGISRSFIDAGKTGTSIRKRKGLQALLRVVESGHCDFDKILVYDISRWGRFPDIDESAHYEYLCKRARIAVHYCAEPFQNDNSTTSNLLKALKRTMAAEYSRELGVKVSTGQRRLASMGFWQGGPAPLGLARLLLNGSREPKRILKPGESKDISTDRVVLTPGDSREIRIIKYAFDLYTKAHKTRSQIADILNRRSMLCGRPWTTQKLLLLFTNPVYRGAYPYGRHHTRNGITNHQPKEKWLVCERAFPAIIPEKQWAKANAQVQKEVRGLHDSEMLDALRRVWKRKGKLDVQIVNAAKDAPSVRAYLNHFGSLQEAYKLIGYPLPRDYSCPHPRKIMAELRNQLCAEISASIRSIGALAEEQEHDSGVVLLNNCVRVRVAIAMGLRRRRPTMEWTLPLHKLADADFLIVARLCPPGKSILDYYVFPAYSGLRSQFRIRKDPNAQFVELYRFLDLTPIVRSFGCLSISNRPATERADNV
jgi:DNA invertase Pin-like site-specific DNA recombinase